MKTFNEEDDITKALKKQNPNISNRELESRKRIAIAEQQRKEALERADMERMMQLKESPKPPKEEKLKGIDLDEFSKNDPYYSKNSDEYSGSTGI